ncbi:hypothetical protein F7R21_05795 [Burkholderia latens]|uniref:Lipoprotein n=1 Tax=Burkholderia latens TaxID=488446 RepID=A0A6H9TJ10_9BURK|nr:hypothetical protein F7R21_05795 [Burkholderia latens]
MNFSSSLPSFVFIASAGFMCAAGAQTLSRAPADTPSFASSPNVATVPPQRSAQAATASAAAEPAATAFAGPASSAAAQPGARARSTLRRPLVPTRPHRAQATLPPADYDVWRNDTLYASPYEKSQYAEPGTPN